MTEVIGNDYLVVGTIEKKAWREGLTQSKSVADMLPQTHDFKSYFVLHQDQWAFLASLRRMNRQKVETVVGEEAINFFSASSSPRFLASSCPQDKAG